MREVITLQIGGTGSHLGNMFWQAIRNEHSIDSFNVFHGASDLQIRYVDTFFELVQPYRQQQRHMARAILADTDPSYLTNSARLVDTQLPSDRIIFGSQSSANVFSKGFGCSQTDRDLPDRVFEQCRIMCEASDSVQGVQILHSVGGGTGSGLTCAVLKKLNEEGVVKGAKLVTWTVVPAPGVSDKVVEPYNAILSVPYLAEYAHAVHLMDNEAIRGLINKMTRQSKPINYNCINSLISKVMCNTSACFRFPGQQNTDWRQLYVNLTPVPKMHFLAFGTAEFANLNGAAAQLGQLLDTKKFLVNCQGGRYITASLLLRGKFRMSEIDTVIARINRDKINNRCLPDAVQRAVCDVPPAGTAGAATLLANHTGGVRCLTRTLSQFRTLLKRRAFLHWYDGYQLLEFQEADNKTAELLKNYSEMEKNGGMAAGTGVDVNEQW